MSDIVREDDEPKLIGLLAVVQRMDAIEGEVVEPDYSAIITQALARRAMQHELDVFISGIDTMALDIIEGETA